jgi:hypothetical protein
VSAPWELGSEFDWALDGRVTGAAESPPWSVKRSDVVYLESGRQALALASELLRQRGFRTLLMPQHFCESMIEPFVRDQWDIHFYEFDDEWAAQTPEAPLASPETTVVLSFPAFGVPESLDWLAFLAEVQSQGSVVISDESHRVLSAGLSQADVRIASLRKMLPLPDGAFVTGLSTAPTLTSGGVQAVARAEAMVEKTRFLSGERTDSKHLAMFARAEELTHRQAAPATMSEVSAERIDAFDWEALRSSRYANAAALTRELVGTSYRVTTSAAEVPSHVVVSGPDVLGLRGHLIASRIYCPIHWVRPEDEPRPASWRDDLLSIPVDHRYTPEDLIRVAEAIHEFETARRN